MHRRHIAWLRYSISILSTGVPSSGAARGEVGRQRMSSGPMSRSMRATISARRALASASIGGRHGRGPGDALLDAGPELRLDLRDPGADARPHLGGLDGAERLEPGTRPSGATSISSPRPISASSRATAGCSASATAGSTSAKASRAMSRRLGFAGLLRSSRSTRPTFSKTPASRANQPATSKLGPNGTAPSERHPAPGRAHAEDAAVAGGNAHRAAAVRADGEIDELARHGRGRPVRRAAGNAPRRVDVDRRAVVHVLAGQAVAELVAMRAPDHVGARLPAGARRPPPCASREGASRASPGGRSPCGAPRCGTGP